MTKGTEMTKKNINRIKNFMAMQKKINDMPKERRDKIMKKAVEMKNIIEEDYDNGILALTLITMGYAMKPERKGF